MKFLRSPPTKTSFGTDGKKQIFIPTNDLQKLFHGSARGWVVGERSTASWPPSATGVSPFRRMGDTLVAPLADDRSIYTRSVAGPSDGRHSCRPWCMRASPPKQVLAPTGRNSFPGPPTTSRSCFLRAHPPKQVLAPTGRNSFLFPPTTYRSCFLRESRSSPRPRIGFWP